MPDFAMNAHFRSTPGGRARRNGFAGGYGWFFGRFSDWSVFERELREHLESIGYIFIECEDSLIIDSIDDLNEGEQRDLYTRLATYPLQYRTLHLYENDDS